MLISIIYGIGIFSSLAAAFFNGHYEFLAIIEVVVLISGLIFRQLSTKLFEQIDWSYVKPVRRVGASWQINTTS